jgi:hypothetical protein
MDPIARVLVDLLKTVAGEVRIAVLGPGFGYECAEMRMELPSAIIETRSLSPINPFRLPLRNIDGIRDVDAAMDRVRAERGYLTEIPLSLLMDFDMEHASPVFFENRRHQPFIDEQVIGNFPSASPLEGKYDLVYDQFGPMQKTDVGGFFAAFAHIQQSLSDEGMAYIFQSTDDLLNQSSFVRHLTRELFPANVAVLSECYRLIVTSRENARRILDIPCPDLRHSRQIMPRSAG